MKINYVIACYITDNSIYSRNNIYHHLDKFFAIKCQINYVNSIKNKNLYKTTFVVSRSPYVNEGDIESIIEQYNTKNKLIEVVYRDNWGRSYAAWEYQIRRSINDGYDYYFLTEDDYCICHENFYIPFLNKMDENTAFVCGVYCNHPAISYKLISSKVCERILNKYGEIFYEYNLKQSKYNHDLYLNDIKGHTVDECLIYNFWQGYYHKNFINEKLDCKDVSDETYLIFRRGTEIFTLSRKEKNTIDLENNIMIMPIL